MYKPLKKITFCPCFPPRGVILINKLSGEGLSLLFSLVLKGNLMTHQHHTGHSPFPLGATLQTGGCQFSVYAPFHAKIQLALFEGKSDDYRVVELPHQEAGIRYGFIADIRAGQRYGYLIEIDGEPLLISDPYAKSIDGPLSYTPPFDAKTSFSIAKSVVIDDEFDWQETAPLKLARESVIICEGHVKGLTKQNPNVAPDVRGTYLGLVDPAMLAFYQQQNINTLQLLPVAACMPEPHLLSQQGVNYWGYNPYLFMAPDPRFAIDNPVTELKTTIRELHKNGIQVILDVVFNHTAEGGDDDVIFNLRGLDPQYYIQYGDHYANFTGCGNTLDLTHQPTLNLVMDSLRYWVEEFHVDGFRFDLAATLGREGEQFNPQSGFFKAIAQDPVLKQTLMIAEPWDIGPNGYQVGHFPFGWNECNDKLRDVSRSLWRGDEGFLQDFTTRLMGSRDLYQAVDWPHRLTVNYITYHDGFTLQDLVSYQEKHNDANGEENRDGHGDNRSANYGVEGPSKDKKITAIRERKKRNLSASLLFAFGIPHVLAADLLSHSQQGNNNAYCQDNEISWINWDLNATKQHFQHWLAKLFEYRQTIMANFVTAFSGESRNKNRVAWYRPQGGEMSIDDWQHSQALILHLGIGKDGEELLYLFNTSAQEITFTLPLASLSHARLICNTANGEVGPKKIATKKRRVKSDSIQIIHLRPPAQ